MPATLEKRHCKTLVEGRKQREFMLTIVEVLKNNEIPSITVRTHQYQEQQDALFTDHAVRLGADADEVYKTLIREFKAAKDEHRPIHRIKYGNYETGMVIMRQTKLNPKR